MSTELEKKIEELADRLFDASLIVLCEEGRLFDIVEGVNWEDWGYDHYDRSLELYGCPPDERMPAETLQKLWKAGFYKTWLNHTDGWETLYVKDGQEFRTDRGQPKKIQSHAEKELRRLIPIVRREAMGLSGMELRAIVDALEFTERNSGLVSDAHIRAKKAIESRITEKEE